MKIFDYEEVVMNWDSYTFPIAVGTPVSVDGVLADNSSAHGLIARTVFAKPDGGDTLKIMTGGFIDMEEIVAGYGQELSSDAVQALCGIHFYKDGVCIPTGGSGGGDDSQKWKEETSTPLVSETVTANETSFGGMASFTYDEFINAEPIIVTFDGVKYTCDRSFPSNDRRSFYGATPAESGYDFSEYPFSISSAKNEVGTLNSIVTQSPGEHTVSISTESITYTDAFKKGVAENSTFYVDFEYGTEDTVTTNRTLSEIQEAHKSGANVIGRFEGGLYSLSEYDDVNLFFTFILVSLSEEGRIYFKSLRVSDYNDSTVVDRTSAYIDGTLDSGGSGGET